MPDSDKAFWWYMHKKSANEFNTGNGKFFPIAFFAIIFHIISNGILIHADEAVIADGNPVCIFSKIVNYRLCAIKRFLAMRYPFFFITGIQQFFESKVILVFFTASMELKFIIFP